MEKSRINKAKNNKSLADGVCPYCKDFQSTIDFRSIGNIWRIPCLFIIGILTGLKPIKIWVRCRDCNRSYLAEDAT